MLAANETVAAHIEKTGLPFIFRNHPEPDPEKLTAFRTFIGRFGFSLGEEDTPVTGKDFQRLQKDIEDSPEENIITRLMLRTMQQAVYEGNCKGHYALGAGYYTHFTSPIRRYPDLQIHRIIKEQLDGQLTEKREEHYRKILPAVATETSQAERRADEAEREVDKMKKVEYMAGHLGEVHEGVISGITNWGMYVELPNTCEGMIRLQNMNDYYIFDENKYELRGEMDRQTFRLGQKVKIYIADADKAARTVDFYLADDVEYFQQS